MKQDGVTESFFYAGAARRALLFLALLAAGAMSSGAARSETTLRPIGGATATPTVSSSQSVTPGKIFGGPIGVPGAATLSTPMGVAVDPTGRVYVANKNSSRVTVYSPALAPVGVITAGLNSPVGIAISSPFYNTPMQIYVANNGGNNVTVYNPDLSQNTAATIAGGSYFAYPTGIYGDPAGDIWVLDGAHVAGYRFDGTYFTTLTGYGASAIGPVGASLAAFGASWNNLPSVVAGNLGQAIQGRDFTLVEYPLPVFVGGVAEDQFNQTYFSDTNNNLIRIMGPDLAPLGSVIKTASSPYGVAVDKIYYRIYVAEPVVNQVEVFSLKPPHVLLGVIK
ncbi:hypothetical protein [Methylocystis heyeri]|nr:hypothetical protein [Methylocystis heyeri]